MPIRDNIILTGFMGSGKSTVGDLIANRLGRAFIDTDVKIEEEQNQTISNIFKEKGEEYFRTLEKLAVADICRNNGLVIATGGGTLLNKDNLKIMEQTGIIFCLTASIDIMIDRMGNRKSRPKAAEKNRNAIIELYESRLSGYNNLPNIIDTSEKSASETAELVINLYNKIIEIHSQ